ncbi:heme-binding protein [Vreelandella titanicae]|uniref:GlcG/HbpS family heme-binding protein n=1 Tax=Vreelandella titanicae TaxID=664683 RepID=UPI00315A67E4
MSDWIRHTPRLTHHAVLAVLHAAIEKSEQLGVAQNIAIVDEGGNLLAFIRMDGAKLLSRETAISKAISAASHQQPTAQLDPNLELKLAIAAGGRLTNLEGGHPLMIGNVCVGGIGVGSGTGQQDIEVAKAGAAVLVEGVQA